MIKVQNNEVPEDHIYMSAQDKGKPCYEDCQDGCSMYQWRKKLLGFEDKPKHNIINE